LGGSGHRKQEGRTTQRIKQKNGIGAKEKVKRLKKLQQARILKFRETQQGKLICGAGRGDGSDDGPVDNIFVRRTRLGESCRSDKVYAEGMAREQDGLERTC